MLSIEIDIQINPLSLRRNLKFFVAFDVLEIRANERFRDIPIPKPVCLGRRIRIRLQIEFFVRTYEKEVEILLRPARPDLSTIFRLSLAERIRLHVDGFRPAPKRRHRIRVELRIRVGPPALNDVIRSERETATNDKHQQHSKQVFHGRFLHHRIAQGFLPPIASRVR